MTDILRQFIANLGSSRCAQGGILKHIPLRSPSPTTKPTTMNATNQNEFPTINGAISALESLQDKIDEIKEQFALSHDSENAIGWKGEDNFGEFCGAMMPDDKEFLRKLVNLGLCLP